MNKTARVFTLLTGLMLIFTGKLFADTAPYPAALERAKIVQEKVTTEIPGSMILGNGDLNGILWVRGGRLKFSITKNDICDGRLDTANDPDLVKVDIANHSWEGNIWAGQPSWAKPYPCPLICGDIDFGTVEVFEATTGQWDQTRMGGTSSFLREAAGDLPTARIKGSANQSAGWRTKSPVSEAKSVTIKVSGSANAKWYLECGGTNVASGWVDAKDKAVTKIFDQPKGAALTYLTFYIWTTDGKPAKLNLHGLSITDKDDKEVKVALDTVQKGKPGQSLTLAEQLDYSNMRGELDIARAVATVEHKSGKETSLRVLHDKNVIVFDTAETVVLSPCKADFITDTKRGTTGGIEWINTNVPGDVDWKGMSFALAHAVKDSRHVVAVVSSMEANNPVEAAIKLAKKTIGESQRSQISRHESGWSKFWSKSGIEISNAGLEAVWYRNLYFLRCCSKPGVEPIGLFMGAAGDVMAWHGVATVDYNFEQCFWGAYVCNHAELAEPYNRFTVNYLPRAKWYADQVYGLEGAFYPVNLFTHQINDPLICKSKNNHQNAYPPYSYFFGVSGWMAQNVWNGYLYNPDRKYLKEMAYPMMKSCAIFYTGILDLCKKTDEGKAIYGPSYSPEHRDFGADNVACDISWTRYALKAAIEGARTLNIDAKLVKEWQRALTLLPDYPRVPSKPGLIADIKGGEPIQFNVAVPALPIFPAGEVNWFSDAKEKQAFLNTIRTLNWTEYNSLIILGGAFARIAEADEAYEWIAKEYPRRYWPNGTLAMINGVHPWASKTGDKSGNFTEQFASAGVIAEMLLQSIGGIVRVFPAWPKDKDAKFTNLRTQGGFLVSAEQKNGKVTMLEITPTVDGDLRILCPWKQIKVNGNIISVDANGVVTIRGKAGKKLKIQNHNSAIRL